MKSRPESAKCCGPQHLPEGEPSHAWSLQELGQFALVQDRRIVAEEKRLTPLYWRMGQALSLPRKQFAHGQWCQYLQELTIDRTRAFKALAIFRGFATAALVEPLTVEEAYAERPRNSRKSPPKRRNNSKGSGGKVLLTTTLAEVARLAGDQLQDDSRLRPAEVRKILALVAKVMDRLEAVRKHLSQPTELKSTEPSPTSSTA